MDNNGNVLYYKKENLLNNESELKINPNDFRIENKNLIIKSNKLRFRHMTWFLLTIKNFR